MNRDTVRANVDRARTTAPAIAVAVLAGVAGVLGSFAAAGDTPGFVAAPVAASLASTLPGVVLTTAILVLGDFGQQVNLLTAVGLAIGGLALTAAGARGLARRWERPGLSAPMAALGGGSLAFVLTGHPASSLGAAAGVGLAVGLAAVDRPGTREITTPDADRRHVLQALAGAVSMGVVGVWLGGRARDGNGRGAGRPAGGSTGSGGDDGVPSRVRALLDEADGKSLEVEGLEPLVSTAFYEVDIASVNPDLDADEWTLSFTGAVAEGRTIDYETLTGMASEDRFVTLRCVGESLNGRKMDTALWTGTPVEPLLDELEVESDCECVMLRAEDDYYEEFPLAALERGFLAWGMNGEILPRAHGYPVRALIPGHWGEINVKWLTEIEFLERETDGFWEERGWHGTGPVNTVAKLHAVNHLDGGRIQVGGHTYAGTRGVSAVHVSTDGGVHWEPATLSDPLPGEDVWRQWSYEYDSPEARHDVVVRAVDGNGTVQSDEESGAFPNGPSGWVSREIRG